MLIGNDSENGINQTELANAKEAMYFVKKYLSTQAAKLKVIDSFKQLITSLLKCTCNE